METYFEKLESLAKERNETDQAYADYLQQLDAYRNLLPTLKESDLVHKSLQRLSDHVLKSKAPLSSLILSLNACFDLFDVKKNEALAQCFKEELQKIENNILLNFK